MVEARVIEARTEALKVAHFVPAVLACFGPII